MKLAFLDLNDWDYDVDTPWERPLGGSQSAMAHLGVALAGHGHDVSLFTRTTRPGRRRGVECVAYAERWRPGLLASGDFDVAVVLNGPAETGPLLREGLPEGTALWLWSQHAHDQPALTALSRPEVRAAWDRYVAVSDWQRAMLLERFELAPDAVHVRRNAFAPAFGQHRAAEEEALAAAAGPPRLAYTSTPFRGLDVLLHAFPRIRERVPAARLDVFSSMAVYQMNAGDDPCSALYADCRSTAGVRYHGSLPQPALAEALCGATLLAYPNTFPETSCIAVLEALASGLEVVTTALGALPETCMGWGRLVPPARRSEGGYDEQALLALSDSFTHAVVEALERRTDDPAGFARERAAQVEDVHRRASWAQRAREWDSLLQA